MLGESAKEEADVAGASTFTHNVVPVSKSRTKTFLERTGELATGARSVARLSKATKRPSPLTEGLEEAPLPLPVPLAFTLTSVVVPLTRLRTKMSLTPLVSLTTRLPAALAKSTNWLSA